MPTEYTAKIAEGISFKDFTWECARAFGALITMRDDPIGAPVPVFKPDEFHIQSMREAAAKVQALADMTPAEVAATCDAEYETNVSYRKESDARNAELKAKYDAMLAKVTAWNPPSEDHAPLRQFMIDQINESIRFDCGYEWPAPVRKDPEQWLNDSMEWAQKQYASRKQDCADDVKRCEDRNRWVAQLRESLAGA